MCGADGESASRPRSPFRRTLLLGIAVTPAPAYVGMRGNTTMSMTMLREQITGERAETAPVPAQAVPQAEVAGATYGMMRECLRAQSAAAPRTTLGRLLGSSPLHPDARDWYDGA